MTVLKRLRLLQDVHSAETEPEPDRDRGDPDRRSKVYVSGKGGGVCGSQPRRLAVLDPVGNTERVRSRRVPSDIGM